MHHELLQQFEKAHDSLPAKQQAAIAAGTDPNTVNDSGMAFGGGGL